MLKIDKNKQLSVITLCCNRLEYTARTVASVTQALGDIDYEYLVINAASSDGTKEWLNYISNFEYYRRVRPIHLNVNRGIWHGYTAGVIESKSDLILITDNDILVHSKDVGQKIISSPHPYGMSDFVAYQRNRNTAYVNFPVAFFYMQKRFYNPNYKLPDDYQTSGLKFFVHKDIICEHIDGGEAGLYTQKSLSKIKYPAEIIYKNLEGDCPMGHFPFRPRGGESAFWASKSHHDT